MRSLAGLAGLLCIAQFCLALSVFDDRQVWGLGLPSLQGVREGQQVSWMLVVLVHLFASGSQASPVNGNIVT